MVIVPKSNGELRICIDFRRLNEITVGDRYPIPLIQEMFGFIKDSQIFTKLDLKRGYWQIGLTPRAKEFCCFITPWGKYSFNRMPFGLINAPSIFQRVIDNSFSEFDKNQVLTYFNDILLMARDEAELSEVEELVFEKCKEVHLTINKAKSEFHVNEVQFLGYKIHNGKISSPDNMIIRIQDTPLPKDLTELRRFIGMVGYYRPLLPKLSIIESPLNSLNRKDRVYKLGEKEVDAINQIKMMIQGATMDTVFM